MSPNVTHSLILADVQAWSKFDHYIGGDLYYLL
jgi:hypothetical protein